MTSFKDLGVPADLVATLGRLGVTSPFPVQEACVPDALQGRDVCGKAPTGSGKTLAFGVPLIARVPKARPHRPTSLVLAPTRELAAQIESALRPLAHTRQFRVAAIYGGVGYERQRASLRRGVEVLVACPGRLRDLLDQKALRLDDVGIVVVDEADRMADMGFLPQVRRLLDECSPKRQTVLFSATLDGDVAILKREYQHDAITHEVVDPSEDADIDHHFEELERSARAARAAEIVRTNGSTIMFTRTRHGADRLAKQLAAAGVGAAAIHGGLSQPKRDRVLAGFKANAIAALVATDVAARGIHVDDVACVVHYDPPADSKTYVHRSGRTARAGATGTVVSFVTEDQRAASRLLRRELGLMPVSTDEARSPGARPASGPGESRRKHNGRGHRGSTRGRSARR